MFRVVFFRTYLLPIAVGMNILMQATYLPIEHQDQGRMNLANCLKPYSKIERRVHCVEDRKSLNKCWLFLVGIVSQFVFVLP